MNKIICALVALTLIGCAGTWEPRARTVATVAVVGLLAADTLQSRWMVEHYGPKLYEQNLLLGRYPSKRTLTLYLGAWAGAMVASRVWLPKWATWTILGVVGSVEAWTVYDNRADANEGFAW
jgi:predicted MFS family arabinose efflux permease